MKGGGASVWLSAGEATLLRTLVVPVMDLLNDPDRPASAAGQAQSAEQAPSESPEPSEPSESDDLFDDLEKMFNETAAAPPEAPADPVLARLLPDAYQDDPEAAGEFRKYTEPALRSAKYQAAQEMLDTLPDEGGRIQLTADQALSWLKALNDVRLALGVRLGVTEEFEEQWSRLKPDDPQWTAYEVYAWLGAVQESLVQALS